MIPNKDGMMTVELEESSGKAGRSIMLEY